MPSYSVADIAEIMQGRLEGDPGRRIDHILTDSRKILYPEGTAFFALVGERRDGHHFIGEAFLRGVRCFIISEPVLASEYPGSSFITVTDTLKGLQDLAAWHRCQFSYPVIGITGSNGKTIVKEWLNHLLQDEYRIVRSPRSYNSQIGVPLSIWLMNDGADLAIIEAGISTRGEMEKLERIIHPGIGIFTNIGDAHGEGFDSMQEKVREKLRLFLHTPLLIYCRDYPELDREVGEMASGGSVTLMHWSRKGEAAVKLISEVQAPNYSDIRLRYKGEDVDFRLPFTGAAAVENAVHCVVAMLHFGIGFEKIRERILTLPAVSMRLEMKPGVNRCTVINDSYSADLSSLKLAMDFLRQQPQHENRTLILSDIPQSGKPDGEMYADIAGMLVKNKVNRLIGIGPQISARAAMFRDAGLRVETHLTTTDFLARFHPLQFRDETILLKGARVFGFERIIQVLEVKQHQTVLSISLSAIAHNLREYRKILSPGTKIMVMVKAFSYGSGSYEIASILQFHKADYLAVAYADEGVELRKSGISMPIMVMNPEEAAFASILEYDLQPELFSFGMMEQFDRYLRTEGITEYPVHLKLDTGMHRLGFESHDLPDLSDHLARSGSFRVISVFTHLTSSEDPAEDEFTRRQSDEFILACQFLESRLGYSFIRHISNTAAIARHPGLQLGMVRLGIGLYGINTGKAGLAALQEASVLTTTIAQVRSVKAGESVGYNRKGVLLRDSRIATIRIGYADGYPRACSNGAGKVMIGNQLVPVVGSVCMDMTMVDVTDIPGAKEGDEVIVFGKGLSLNDLAAWAGTISYDIMTGISQRVKRVYYEE